MSELELDQCHDEVDKLRETHIRLAKSVIKHWRKGYYNCNFCTGVDGKHTPHCVVPLARRIVEGNDDH